MDRPDVRAAIETVLEPGDGRAAGRDVERIMARYRDADFAGRPVLSGPDEAAAYALYRMPATVAAARSALAAACDAAPSWAPRSVVDVGAGTGATSWAAADVLSGVESFHLLEPAEPAARLGQRLLAASGDDRLRRARWSSWTAGPDPLPAADLALLGYSLGEMGPAVRARLLRAAVDACDAVLVLEPGTPRGYRTVVEARRRLLDAGFAVAAPCPHGARCPVEDDDGDWCHLAERVQRSAAHRRSKGATLSYEDEKFSYVLALRGVDVAPPEARVLRRPVYRKGLVELEVCHRDSDRRRLVVSKRAGAAYRAARDLEWGDGWSPPAAGDDGGGDDGG